MMAAGTAIDLAVHTIMSGGRKKPGRHEQAGMMAFELIPLGPLKPLAVLLGETS
jgi:hypothetical protein